jgi:hypothetical protein
MTQDIRDPQLILTDEWPDALVDGNLLCGQTLSGWL